MTGSHRILPVTLALALAASCLIAAATAARAQDRPITIRAARALDGKGKLLQNATVEIVGSKIATIDRRPRPACARCSTRDATSCRVCSTRK